MREKLTYANVVATLALFLVVAGGTAFATTQLAKNSVGPKQLRKNAVTTAKIKNGAVTAAKIKNGAVTGSKIETSSLGTVPSAANANALEGRPAGSFAPAHAEPLHIVGAPGEVSFETGWERAQSLAGYWKDPFGTVHLQGQVKRGSGAETTIFILPDGFRPAEEGFFEVYTGAGDHTTTVEVSPDGRVELFIGGPEDENFVALDGISFRAAGT